MVGGVSGVETTAGVRVGVMLAFMSSPSAPLATTTGAERLESDATAGAAVDVTGAVAMGALLVVAGSTCVVDIDIDLVVTERCAGDVSCPARRCGGGGHDIGSVAGDGEADRGEHAFGVCGLVLPGVIAIAFTSQLFRSTVVVRFAASAFRAAQTRGHRSALR